MGEVFPSELSGPRDPVLGRSGPRVGDVFPSEPFYVVRDSVLVTFFPQNFRDPATPCFGMAKNGPKNDPKWPKMNQNGQK